MSTQTLPLKGPVNRSSSVGAADSGDGACALLPTLTRPPGYTAAEDPAKGWVTWGHWDSRVFSNIASPYTLSTGLKIYAKATTNGAIPLRILSAEIETSVADLEDTGGTETTPPTTIYYLLGQVGGAGTEGSPFRIFTAGCGNLSARAEAVGFECMLATSGDPEAEPPVPASAGGVRTNYQLIKERVA